MITVDTREQKWEHIKRYFDENGIEYKVEKLDTADYASDENPSLIIDRKANLQEVCSNLQSGRENYHRFLNECKRAYHDKVRFIVLVEGTNCRQLKDVCEWNSKYTKHTGKWLANQMWQLSRMYGVEWRFCKKSQTPERIARWLLEGVNDG